MQTGNSHTAQSTPWSLQDSLQRRTDRQAAENATLNLLHKHLLQADKVPFYHQLFKSSQCSPDTIKNLKDFSNIPLTSREDIDQNPDLFSLGNNGDYGDIALTSGTTGDPVVVPYTNNDLQRLAFNETMSFYGAGIKKGDRVLLTVTLDRCFIAGLAYYSGLVNLGATAIRSGAGQAAKQWYLIDKLRPRVIIGVPSFLLHLASWGKSHGFDPAASSVETLIAIGEPVRTADYTLTRQGTSLCEQWDSSLYSTYGATEIETAFCECSAGCGGHVHPEMMIVEIIDEQSQVVADNTPGEVVVTPLGVEGFPLVRFRTGDIARIDTTPCKCGWTTPRLGPIEGRLAQRLKYRGTTIYPEMVSQALQEIPEIKGSYIEVRSAFDLSDEITVVIGQPKDKNEKSFEVQHIKDILQARLRVCPAIRIESEDAVRKRMEESGGRKLQRFFDMR